ncbi:MAG: hypothetical protein P5692_26065, partial [Limnospira sp. PMC 1280.21]|nr:hypothetical protein [Limnospira sp. PMC 1280.21]
GLAFWVFLVISSSPLYVLTLLSGAISSTVLNGSWGRRLPFRPLTLEGEGCDQKLKPNCHGGDMPTGHGVDIDTAIIRSVVARTS